MEILRYSKRLNDFINQIKLGSFDKNKKIEIEKNIYCYFDSENSFAEIFDNQTGFYIMSDILDENFKATGKDATRRNAPALLDIGIMGHCRNGAFLNSAGEWTKSSCQIGCYQSAKICGQDMSLELYKSIIDSIKDKTFQIALGGAGNPDEHSQIEEILKYTVESGLVPNFTTSGISLTPEKCQMLKKYVGAVAVSYHPKIVDGQPDFNDCCQYTKSAVEMLLEAGIKVNIHYVLGKNSIDRAISMLENQDWLSGINAVIFLRYKPVGFATRKNCLDIEDPKTKKFFELVDNFDGQLKIGFDSCGCQFLNKFCKNVNSASILPCEAGSFSAYIDAQGRCMPCSFGNSQSEYSFIGDIMSAWNSDLFKNFQRHSCPWLGIEKAKKL